MSPAAIKATYSDLRLVKGRKVAVIYLEIPIEQAEQFVGSFGMPNPAEEKWVAIARLTPESEQAIEPVKERQKFSRLRPSAQAALLCEKLAFRVFLKENMSGGDIADDSDAAAFVRTYCHVESRAELDRDGDKAALWVSLRDKFDAWAVAA